MDNLVGKRLGPYEIVEFIASGGMAEVYKGYHAELDRYVAIKIVGRHLDPDPVFNARFRREAKAIAKLRHPNIVQVFDFGAAEGGHYMVMEFIEGQDLAGYMIEMRSQRRLMEPADLAFLTRQIGLALDHAHSKGVVHRDVKPGNVMLTRAGQAILTDFGLALLNSRSVEDQSSGTAFGTPEYMSPEQVTDSRAATASSDLYSLGVMVFELVTGQLPFTGGSPVETAMRHLNEMPPDPRDINPNVPPSVAAVVLHAMSKDPAERFRTGSHLASALEQAYRSPDKMPILDPPTRPRVEARTEAVGAPAEVVANRGLTGREGRQEKARLEAEHRKLKREERREQAARRRVERRNSRSTFFAAWGRTIFVVLILALLVLAGGYVLQTLGVISVDLGGGGGTPAVAEAEPTSTEADSAAPPAADAGDEATATPTAGPDPTEPATPPTDQPTSTMAPTPTPLQPAQATAVPTISQEPLTLGDDAYRIVDGQVMQFVPEGIFQMGTDDPNRNESDRPQHPVRLDAYWLDRTEITNAQYRICVEEGTCPPPSDTSFYDDPDFSQYPVMFVNYDGAASYCLWVAGQTDQVVGLPTEAQWEKAAGWDPVAGEARLYPWGDEPPNPDLLRYPESNLPFPAAPVASYPEGASAYGVLDLSGNVWEWAADWFDPDYYDVSGVLVNPTGPLTGDFRVTRGGSWTRSGNLLLASFRNPTRPVAASNEIGFRCAVTGGRLPEASGVTTSPLAAVRALIEHLNEDEVQAANDGGTLAEWTETLSAIQVALQAANNAEAQGLITGRLDRIDTQVENGLLNANTATRLRNGLSWIAGRTAADE